MSNTVMKAWQFREVGVMPTLVEVPEPVVAPGEVVIDVRAAGLCHTDVGVVEGIALAMLNHWPLVLGHEVAGVVAEVGVGVTNVKVGDRVGVATTAAGPGAGRDGGYAPRTSAPADSVVLIPEHVSFVQAAAGADAGLTATHAVRVTGGVTAGMKVGIVGVGGLGMTGASIAVLQGAEVWAAEPNTAVHDEALQRGVTKCVTDVAELGAWGPDVIIDFAGMNTTAAAIAAVRVGGRVVQVGVGRQEATIDVPILVGKMVELVGNNAGTVEDFEYYLSLVEGGKLKPLTETITFDEIGEGLERVKRGGIRGRLVAEMG